MKKKEKTTVKNSKEGSNPGIKRKILIVLTVAALFAAYVFFGNTVVTVSHYDISSEKIPPDFDGFCIVQISDLHNSHNTVMTESLISKSADAAPDIILLTGDIIDSYHPDIPTAISVVKRLKEIASVYYVIGNHEARSDQRDALITEMNNAGIIVLNNSCCVLKAGSDEIVIAGMEDPRRKNTDGKADDTLIASNSLSSIDYDREKFAILLSHRPELIDTYAAYGFDIVFTGHAHGGLIRLPFIKGLFAPNQGLFPDYTYGLYKADDTSMIVNRGAGNSGYSFRINDPPEIAVAVLHAE